MVGEECGEVLGEGGREVVEFLDGVNKNFTFDWVEDEGAGSHGGLLRGSLT